MTDGMGGLIGRLSGENERNGAFRCLVGFDGYVDRIVRIVKSSSSFDDHVFFRTIGEFADHVKASSGKSADMRVISQETRVGGNGPILAAALSRLGVWVTCVGALGDPDINPVFKSLPSGCETVGIAEPGYTDAFEFDDGKLMFGNVSGFDRISWEGLKWRLGLDRLKDLVGSSDLIGVVNWSALHGTDGILEGFADEIFPLLPEAELGRKYLAVDIADPSARSKADFEKLFAILARLSPLVRLVLCLNEKEARILRGCLPGAGASEPLRAVCESIFHGLSPAVVQIHALKSAVGMDANGFRSINGVFVEKPTVTTGGGDNFNAGFLFGLVLGLPLEDALIAGNAAAASYVTTGESPSSAELARFIQLKAEQGTF
jgi:sugar/nucleoside kinase (ribokinase family)